MSRSVEDHRRVESVSGIDLKLTDHERVAYGLAAFVVTILVLVGVYAVDGGQLVLAIGVAVVSPFAASAVATGVRTSLKERPARERLETFGMETEATVVRYVDENENGGPSQATYVFVVDGSNWFGGVVRTRRGGFWRPLPSPAIGDRIGIVYDPDNPNVSGAIETR